MVRQFRGSGLLFLRNVFLYSLVMGPLVSVCLMGSGWPHLFLSLLVLSLIVLPPAAAVLDRIDGFSFDDERRAIIKPLGKDIPYERVQSLDLRETSGLLRVTAGLGRFTSLPLASALPGRDRERLLEEFASRAPHAVIRLRRHADWKSLLVIAVVVLAAAGLIHAFLYTKRPALKTLPQQFAETQSAEAGTDASGTKLYPVGGFDVLLPVRFVPGKPEGSESVFVDNAGRTLLRAEADTGKTGGIKGLLMRAAGMGDRAEVLERAYTARVGVILLLLKEIALAGMEDVQIFEIRNSALRGYITRGTRKNDEVAFIVLSEGAGGASISLSLSSPKRWDEASLQRIASAVSPRRK